MLKGVPLDFRIRDVERRGLPRPQLEDRRGSSKGCDLARWRPIEGQTDRRANLAKPLFSMFLFGLPVDRFARR